MSVERSLRPKLRPKKKKEKTQAERIDEMVADVLHSDGASGTDYKDDDGEMRSPEQDTKPRKQKDFIDKEDKGKALKNGGMIKSKGYAAGGRVRAGDVRFNNKRGMTY